MPRLNVTIDSFAFLRTSGNSTEPDPVQAAVLAELAGAGAISAGLNDARSPVQDRDVYMLKRMVITSFNLNIPPSQQLTALALDLVPARVTFVPESTEGHRTEGGVDVRSREKEIAKLITSLADNGIPAGLLIEPDIQQLRAALRCGATHVQLLCAPYANGSGQARIDELDRLRDVADVARRHNLTVLAGGRLSYTTVQPLAHLELRGETLFQEMVIGHALAARASLVGIDTAVRDLLVLL